MTRRLRTWFRVMKEKSCKKIEEDSELRKKQEVHEIEERKNQHIIELMKKHEKAFADIKFYYNDITQNNLDLIKTLKEDITDMKKKEQANEKFMYEIAQENKHSMEPLTKALKELDVLRKHIQVLEKDRQALQQLRVHYADTLEQIKHLEWQYRSLQEKMDKAKQAILRHDELILPLQVQEDKDDLYARFESCIFDVQQKCGLKSMLLEKKLHVVQEQLEKKEAQLGESLAGKLQPGKVDYKFDKVLETKNQQIKSLYYELGRVTKAHDSIVKAFEVKLAALGVPLQEMGLPYYLSKIQL
ncbi:growth arrest-specific protein 8 homolog isoform X2 [Selaginella moellendorffii]|uniref:growth arrest-specific protein 8 homolog isoform X2 n=1 Tax=Selaginella moellendorffii TaxID=88036 RepID=UPI000D1C4CBA|nr:growth arrest-specific protein 8 homolog isoform X2 [Selaginella moellendorffii]|eukprot:XP_024519874.1 growth arrest-specific protein 8 homolog isoform X2 [Selaginella moellendorffii]